MTFNYTATAATATRLLQNFGAAATLTRVTPGTYDPDTGTSTPTETDLSTTAAVFDMDQKYVDGTLVLQGDKIAYCAPAVEPEQGDRFTWQGTAYTIVAVKPISPAGTAVLFEAQIRGS